MRHAPLDDHSDATTFREFSREGANSRHDVIGRLWI